MAWSVERQGTRAVIRVWRKDRGEGLYKAYLVGPGRRSPLGTLTPEGGWLTLRRALPVDDLQRDGLWPVRQVAEELVYSFQDSSIRWEDPVLRSAAGRLPGHTLLRQGDGFVLRFPFDPGRPFPIPALFCFARLRDGQLFFSFHSGGIPYISTEMGEDKKDNQGKECVP